MRRTIYEDTKKKLTRTCLINVFLKKHVKEKHDDNDNNNRSNEISQVRSEEDKRAT